MEFSVQVQNFFSQLYVQRTGQKLKPQAMAHIDGSDSESKRRKVIRSCLFCRKRKLGCDHKRPTCSTCKLKNPNPCKYTDNDNTSLTPDEHGTNSSLEDDQKKYIDLGVTLDKKVIELQKQIEMMSELLKLHLKKDHATTKIQKGYLTSGNEQEEVVRNPLYDFRFFQIKDSGKRIMYGPTSTKTYIANEKSGFGEKATQLFSKVKLNRSRWKKKNKGMTGLNEMELLEDPYGMNMNNLLEDVCTVLPSHQECTRVLDQFFASQNHDLYHMNCILDKNKVYHDFFNSFIADTTENTPNGETLIKSLQPGSKKNYFKIGVILMILCIVKYEVYIPMPIVKFTALLTGQVSAKVNFIERVVFLALRCEHRRFYVVDGDDTHLLHLVSLTSNAAITMGLDRNIQELYKNQENVTGTLDSLENLWYSVLFLDFEVSFLSGRPLGVTNASIDIKPCLLTNSQPADDIDAHRDKLKKFLKLTRPMMLAIMKPNDIPLLNIYCIDILNFITTELPNSSEFTDKTGIQSIPIGDIQIFILCLLMVITFNSLRYSVYGENSIDMRDLTVQCGLVLLKVNSNLLNRCFNMDKKYFNDRLVGEINVTTPYINKYLYLSNGLIDRVSTVFSTLTYNELTNFETAFITDKQDQCCEWDFTYLTKRSYRERPAILEALNIYCSLIAEWANPTDSLLHAVLDKSQAMSVLRGFEQIYRTIVVKTLEFRAQTESVWLEKDNKFLQEDESTSESTKQYLRNSYSQPSSRRGKEGNIVEDSGKNAQLNKAISKDFWDNYNSGWDEIMCQAYTDNFLNNL